MKRFAILAGLLLSAGVSNAAFFPRVEVYSTEDTPVVVKENSITAVGTPTTVSVSTSAWTVVPAASSLTERSGMIVSLPAAANAVMVGHFGGCTSTAIATTVRPLELAKGGFILVPAANDVCLYLMSLHTAAESVHIQEIGQ